MDFSKLPKEAFIDGIWQAAASGDTFEVTNPYTKESIGAVANCGATETTMAIAAASRAFKGWSDATAKYRADVLMRWHDLILEHIDYLSTLITMEQGKPLREAKGEVRYGVSFVRWFAEEARRAYGDVIPTFQEDKQVLVFKQAVGVVGAITPWNFPSAMITRKLAPALAAGCTCVLKPSEETPFSALALAELAAKAGFPAGVINVVTSDDAATVGQLLCASDAVKKMSFTGSTKIGKLIAAQSVPTLKRISMELGGNAPFIVCEDADLDAAVAGAMVAKFRSTGQSCIAANRFYIHQNHFEDFKDALMHEMEKLKLGNGLDQAVDIGPLINRQAIEKIKRLVQDAESKGATTVLGGSVWEAHDQVFLPTMMEGITEDMDIAHEEIFGPVICLQSYEDEDELLVKANATKYGLASYFYSRDVGRIFRIAFALEYGMVGVNTGFLSSEVAPFGGIKQSGVGREGSKYGLDDYLNIKYVCLAD